MATWEEHWAANNTPWDQGAPAPSLVLLLKELIQDPQSVRGRRALVPGCGAGYDAFCLAQAGFEAVGLDIAPSARAPFDAARVKSGVEAGASPHQVRLLTLDFFESSLEELGGPYDFIWDYTFYCAIDRELRSRWKKRMIELLAPGGTLATLLFPVDPSRPSDQGPPYSLDPQLVTESLRPELSQLALKKVSESHPDREGKEYLALWTHSMAH